jgi:acyl carrier protein
MARTFKIDAAALPPEPDIDNVENWDSLRHTMLLLAIESEYSVSIPLDLGPTLTSQAAIARFLGTDRMTT